jgi:glycine oxidase
VRFCVIGNGIIGSLVALNLVRLDKTHIVELWGPLNRKFAGSAAAAAMLNSVAEIDRHTFANEINAERFSHSRLSKELWDDIDASVFDGGIFSAGGYGTHVLRTGSPESLEDENWQLMEKALDDFSIEFDIVESRSVPGYLPRRGFESAEALWIPGEGWMDPEKVLKQIDQLLDRSSNVSVHPFEASEIQESHDSIRVRSELGIEQDFDKVVIASGHRSLELAGPFLLEHPRHPHILAGEGVTIRLQVAALDQATVVRTANRGLACGLYSAPYAGELVVGASNHVTTTPSGIPGLESVRSILTMVSNELNSELSQAGVLRVNYGIRPVSTDSVPMIGLVSQHLFMISGTRRDGWHMAPLIAKYASETVSSGESSAPESMKIYSPLRESYRFLSVEDSVSEAIQHYISGLDQHGYKAAFGSYENQIIRNYRHYFEKLHEDLGIDFGLPVEMIGVAGTLRDRGLPYPY